MALGFAGLLVAWLVYLTLVVTQGAELSGLRDSVLYGAIGVGATTLVVLRAVRVRTDRVAWTAMAVGLVVTHIAQLVYLVAVSGRDQPPFPSPADPFYLAAYVAWYASIAILVRERLRRVGRSLWLDGAIAVLAAAALLGVLLDSSVRARAAASPAAVVVSTAYPVADAILVLLGVFGVVLLGTRTPAPLWWFIAAMLTAGVADLYLWAQVAEGMYARGTVVSALWPLSRVLLAAAAWAPTPTQPRRHARQGVMLVAPAASMLIATGVLVAAAALPVPPVAVIAAALALLVVLVRLLVTIRETGQMADAQRIAATDELTELPNRRGFTARAGAALAGARTGRPAALLMLDVDGFKEVNDSLGHHCGDLLLEQLAERLRAALRSPDDVLGRLGGDEFALALPEAPRAGAESVAERIAVTLGAPFVIEGVQVQISASVGIALAPEHGQDLALLLRRADIAMYRAKVRRLGRATYDPERDGEGEARLQRSAELRRAVEQHEHVLHYQPKIALDDGRTVAVEALVRWQRGDTLVYPDQFLPGMEEVGLMPALTAVVLEEAVGQAAAWQQAGIRMPVAVNLPTAAVVDEALPQRIADLLARHRVAADLLQIEITEESLLRDRTRAQGVLARLRLMGIRISIDDYGSGYSSLAYLRELTVDEIKLDRAFVLPMADDARAASIVRSTIELAHALGLGIVAEGVEHEAAAHELRRYGCDTAQGYHWSRPVPATDLVSWLVDRSLPTQRSGAGSDPSDAPQTAGDPEAAAGRSVPGAVVGDEQSR